MVSRNAQGISLNVIIIAAIALVVMVILIALVLNSSQQTSQGVNACQGLGEENSDWKCVEPAEGCGEDWIRHPSRGCEGSTDDFPLYCCFPIS